MPNGIDFELLHTEEEYNTKKDAILLFHGLTGSPFEMKKYGEFLFKNGYDVFCYSFPGHGERIDEIESVTWKDWCEFAQNKYSILRKNYNHFFVSGLCLGAAMAIYLAENNDDLSGVMALSTTLFLDGFCIPWTIVLLPFVLRTIIRFYYTFPEDKSFGVKNERTRKGLAKVTAKANIGMDNYPLNCVYGLLRLSKNVRKNLSKVNCPILCIHSKFDNLSSTKSASVVMNGVSSKIKKYIEIQDSYHMILYDNEKEFVMNSVKKFVEEINPKEKILEAV